MDKSSEETFSLPQEVKKRKNQSLKIRLQTLVQSKGMSEADFYNKLGISKQYWFSLSWGLWTPPLDLKIKISKALDTDSSLIWRSGE